MRDEYDFTKSVKNPYVKKLQNTLENPFWDTLAKFIKKFKSSKSYWSVSFIVILFTLREVGAWWYCSALSEFAQRHLENSDYSWFLTAIEFIFGIGGSLELALGGLFIFLILSLVKASEGENNTITLRDSFLSLLLLLTLLGMGIYGIASDDKNHLITHKEQKITHDKQDEIKAQQKITNDKLDKIDARLKLLGGDESDFLEKYFGKDYAIILNHPQTYHNFTTLLKQTNKTADELLKEREELLNKIKSQNFSPKLQAQIDKAFKELRYEDARDLLDTFLEGNSAKEKQIIQAHYLKALSFMQQIQYYKAKDEFEKIAPNIDDEKILNEYGQIYFILGEYEKALDYYGKSLKVIRLRSDNNRSIATLYSNIGATLQYKKEYEKAMIYYKKALKITLSTLGNNHLDTALNYSKIGTLLFSTGENDKALEYYYKALKIRYLRLGDMHPDTAHIYINKHNIYKQR